MKYVVGLTGGIGSGKTTVAERFAALGAGLVDTDALSHRMTGAGGEAMAAIGAAFGPAFLTPEGALDRVAMRQAAFADPQARARLEAILHPRIREAAARDCSRAPGPYVLLVVPLLFESGSLLAQVRRTLVVDCPEALQVERAAARSGLAPGEVRAVMAAQWPRWRRLQSGDDVIWNGGEPSLLDPQCERLHRNYLEAAS